MQARDCGIAAAMHLQGGLQKHAWTHQAMNLWCHLACVFQLGNLLQASGNVVLVAAIDESGCKIRRCSSDWLRSLLQQMRA